MKRSFLLGVVLLTASSGMASAGVYLGLGVGTNGFEDSAHIFQTDGRALRLFGGFRFPNLSFGAFSVEGGLEGYDLFNGHSDSKGYTTTDFFAAGKFSLPLGSDFDAYARLGLQRTSLSGSGDFAGSGYLAGAGIEFHINTQVVSGSLFVDFTRNGQTLSGNDGHSVVDSSVDRWMLGLTVGF
jgi:Outer membrane protein beta-barrel domain